MIILAAIVFIVYPFSPLIKYHFLSLIGKTPDTEGLSSIPETNTLIIPKIGVNIEIVEGKDESALNKGAWRMPQTSTPDKGGNTVLTGHRWKYRPPSEETFYLLDKLEMGDNFIVYWQGFEYDYKVASISVVFPDELDVLNPTSVPTITLITCTPLFSTEQRLIVRGERI